MSLYFQKGLLAEKVVEAFYLKRGFQTLLNRKKILRVEVDLLFLSPRDEIHLVEVKKVQSRHFDQQRLKKSQWLRLTQVCEYLSHSIQKPIVFEVALVEGGGRVEVFPAEDLYC